MDFLHDLLFIDSCLTRTPSGCSNPWDILRCFATTWNARTQRIHSCGTVCRAGSVGGEIQNVQKSTNARAESITNGLACDKCTDALSPAKGTDFKWRTNRNHKNIESQCRRQCTNGLEIFPAAATHIPLCSTIYSLRYLAADIEEWRRHTYAAHCTELQSIELSAIHRLCIKTNHRLFATAFHHSTRIWHEKTKSFSCLQPK